MNKTYQSGMSDIPNMAERKIKNREKNENSTTLKKKNIYETQIFKRYKNVIQMQLQQYLESTPYDVVKICFT